MLKIEIIIRPEKLDEIKKLLRILGINGMTVTEVEGVGKQPAESRFYRGKQFTVDLLPKVKIEIVVAEDKKQNILEQVMKTARTGNVGDGKIFVSMIEEVYRIRTGQEGQDAL